MEVKFLGALVQNPNFTITDMLHSYSIWCLVIVYDGSQGWEILCHHVLRLGRLDHVYASNLFATEVTLIRLLDYALHNTNRRRNWLKLEVRMFMIWIARMTKKT